MLLLQSYGVWDANEGVCRSMTLQARYIFLSIFALFAAIYGAVFNFTVWTQESAALSRFETLSSAERHRPAAMYGQRALVLGESAGRTADELSALRAQVARSLIAAGRRADGIKAYTEVTQSDWFEGLSSRDQAAIRDHMARALLVERRFHDAMRIYADFLEGVDAVPEAETADGSNELAAFYAGAIELASDLFAEAFKPVDNADVFRLTDRDAPLTAFRMAKLGSHYALSDDGLYAAAGLLSTSYEFRKANLGADHQETIRTALILGPVYNQMGRLEDAETLYLDAFHAQEKIKGSNNPDLSLYIKLLAGVYQSQGRGTEAQALNEHMRRLFEDAFGAQRYAINRTINRKLDVDRPVSKDFVLSSTYAPTDLVAASQFQIPLSKNPGIDEMKIRLAADEESDLSPREANLPVRLAQLISLCRSETNERLSLRSGYRSHHTQRALFQRLRHKGTVTPPGMSEHQLGLAIDIDVNGRLMRQTDKAYQCFVENGFRFGFILSYPPGNKYLPTRNSFEPWHWRYVGVETAQLYREAGPVNQPQEFLAALPCYAEQALRGSIPTINARELCHSGTSGTERANALPVSSAMNESASEDANNEMAADVREDQPSASAQKLNNAIK